MLRWWVRLVGVWLFGWCAAPGGRGGMFVADEGGVAVVGGWLFSWSPPRRPSSFTSFQILHILVQYMTSSPQTYRRHSREGGRIHGSFPDVTVY